MWRHKQSQASTNAVSLILKQDLRNKIVFRNLDAGEDDKQLIFYGAQHFVQRALTCIGIKKLI
jgi:hypothetical protein